MGRVHWGQDRGHGAGASTVCSSSCNACLVAAVLQTPAVRDAMHITIECTHVLNVRTSVMLQLSQPMDAVMIHQQILQSKGSVVVPQLRQLVPRAAIVVLGSTPHDAAAAGADDCLVSSVPALQFMLTKSENPATLKIPITSSECV